MLSFFQRKVFKFFHNNERAVLARTMDKEAYLTTKEGYTVMTHFPLRIFWMAHSLWTLWEQGKIWQPVKESYKNKVVL